MSLDTYLQLIQDTRLLLREESLIFASPVDVSYFRSLTKAHAPPQPRLATIPKILPPPPLPEPQTPPPQPVILSQPPEPQPPPTIAAPAPWRTQAQLPKETFNTNLLQALLKKIAPNVAIINDPPNDTIAKKQASRWKTKNQIAPISILCFNEMEKQKTLLEEITKAIDVYFGPAKLISAESIEKEKQWDAFLVSQDLKLVIACDYTIWQLSDLMRYYKEIPSAQTRFLGNVPLFLLPDLSLYLKDPLLKRSLWKALCQTISS